MQYSLNLDDDKNPIFKLQFNTKSEIELSIIPTSFTYGDIYLYCKPKYNSQIIYVTIIMKSQYANMFAKSDWFLAFGSNLKNIYTRGLSNVKKEEIEKIIIGKLDFKITKPAFATAVREWGPTYIYDSNNVLYFKVFLSLDDFLSAIMQKHVSLFIYYKEEKKLYTGFQYVLKVSDEDAKRFMRMCLE